VPPNLVLGLVLVMAGVGAMTVPDSAYRNRINWLRARLKGPGRAAGG
jgi:hypothetical protein